MEKKQVIVMRKIFQDKDGNIVNPRKGKLIVQGAHASLKAILDYGNICNNEVVIPLDLHTREWILSNFKKICVQVNTEQELLSIYEKAKNHKDCIPCSLVKDSGLTEFHEPTFTCCAIGPANEDIIDEITGQLTLF
jgi:PTH2 family peptidyl-tRNA hydrolase